MFPIFMPQLKGHLWNIPESSILPLGRKPGGELMEPRQRREGTRLGEIARGSRVFPCPGLVAQRISVWLSPGVKVKDMQITTKINISKFEKA
jgi:hypothetical protein